MLLGTLEKRFKGMIGGGTWEWRGKLAGFGFGGPPSGVVIGWRRGCPALRRPDGDL